MSTSQLEQMPFHNQFRIAVKTHGSLGELCTSQQIHKTDPWSIYLQLTGLAPRVKGTKYQVWVWKKVC